MLNIFRRRLAQIMQRDHEVWIGGQRYVRHDQIEEAASYAEKNYVPKRPFPEEPRHVILRDGEVAKPKLEAFEL